MDNVELILSNKSSPLNKKLLDYIKINLLTLNSISIIFKFTIACANDAEKYKSLGIVSYPVLISNNTKVTGSDKIMTYLNMCIQKKKSKKVTKTDTDCIDDFWKQTMGNVKIDESGKLKPDDDDDDIDDNGTKDLQHKIQKAFEDRNNGDTNPAKLKPKNTSPARPNNIMETPTQTIKNMKSSGSTNIDDDLMSKFFENQEESI